MATASRGNEHQGPSLLKIQSVLEVITAAHLSNAVEVDPRMSMRGGIMLVAPPASFKSTIINQLETFPNAKVLSDTNVRQMMQIRDDIANGSYTSIGLLELGKIYQRQDTTSQNVEGHLMAMVDEGFKHGANGDSRLVVRVAKCFLVAGMTPNLYKQKYTQWLDTGFARRFIWCHYIMRDRQAILRAIHKWKPIDVNTEAAIYGVPLGSIPYDLSDKESGHIAKLLRYYTDIETPFILMKKVLCVLKWREKELRQSKNGSAAMDVLNDFAESLTKQGAELDI